MFSFYMARRGRNWLMEEEKKKTTAELFAPTTSINGTFVGNEKIGAKRMIQNCQNENILRFFFNIIRFNLFFIFAF